MDLFSKQELKYLLDLADICLHIENNKDLVKVVDKLYNSYPYHSSIICSLKKEKSSYSIQHYINHSYNQHWVKTYLDNQYNTVDPVISHVKNSNGYYNWREASDHSCDSNSKEKVLKIKQFLTAAQDFGYKDGVAFSVNDDKANSATIVSLQLTGDSGNASDKLVRYIIPHIHEAMQKLFKGKSDKDTTQSLSAREQEVLKWVVAGKTA